MKTKDGMVQVNGLRLFYRRWQCPKENAETLVLLHGNGGSVVSWDVIAPVLAQNFNLLAFDFRGHGYSDWARDGDYSARTMASDVAKAIEAFGLNEFSLLGHSMGGRVAIAFAETQPPGLQRLIIEDIRPQPHSLMGVSRPDAFTREEAMDMFMQRQVGITEAAARRFTDSMMLTEDGRLSFPSDPVIHDPAIDRRHMSADEAWRAFLAITVPTLLVRGGLSETLTAEEAALMAAEGQNCQLVTIQSAGHGVHNAEPEAFVAAVIKFLN